MVWQITSPQAITTAEVAAARMTGLEAIPSFEDNMMLADWR
jgi:hypothetical protein